MATARLRALSHVVECPVCTESMREPKTLPCQHTVCLRCLGHLQETSNHVLKCPMCRATVRLPLGNIKNLPTNYTVVQLRDALVDTPDKEKDPSERECAFCNESNDSDVGSYKYCQECTQYLCIVCADRHNSRPMFSSHHLVEASDNTVFCQSHKHAYRYVCVPCSRLLCIACVDAQICEDHDIKELAQVADAKRREMQELVTMLSASVAKQEGHEKVNATLLRHINRESKHVSRQSRMIKQHIQILHTFVETKGEELLKTCKIRQKELAQMKSDMESMTVNLAVLQSLKDAALEAQCRGTAHIVSALPTIQARIPPTIALDMTKMKHFKTLSFNPSQSLDVGQISWDEIHIDTESSVAAAEAANRSGAEDMDTAQEETTSAEEDSVQLENDESLEEQEIQLDMGGEGGLDDSIVSNSSSVDRDLEEDGEAAGSDEQNYECAKQSGEIGLAWEKIGFSWCCDAVFLPSGNLVVSDNNKCKVVIYNENGDELLESDTCTDAVKFLSPLALAYHPQMSVVLVADCDKRSGSLKALDPNSLALKQTISLEGVNQPRTITALSDGELVTADVGTRKISVHTLTGTCKASWRLKGGPRVPGGFPGRMTRDSHDRILIGDHWNCFVEVYDRHGSFLYRFGDDELLPRPRGLCVDHSDYCLVVSGDEDHSHQVSLWSSDGVRVSTLVSWPNAVVEENGWPWSVAANSKHMAVVAHKCLWVYNLK